jgi:hypothetical protein
MRMPSFAYIALGLLFSIFAYGYFNYPIADDADRFQSHHLKNKIY